MTVTRRSGDHVRRCVMAAFWVRPQRNLPISWEVPSFLWDDMVPDVMDPGADWADPFGIDFELPGRPVVRVNRPSADPNMVRVRSKDDHLAARAAFFLAAESSGTVADEESGPGQPPEQLVPRFGEGFALDAAYDRVRRQRRRLPKFFEKHFGLLQRFVPGELVTVSPDDRRVIRGRCTHPQAPLPRWVSKGYEGYSAFAAESDLPDRLFACLSVGYPSQEWAFALWYQRGRRFWFGAPVIAVYRDADVGQAAGELANAVEEWEKGDEDVLFMSGLGRLRPGR